MVKSGWIGSSILVQSFLHYLKTKGLADWSIPFDISIFQNVFQAGYNGLLDWKYSAS